LAAEKIPFKLLIVGGNRNPVVENRVKQLFAEVATHVVFTGFLTGASLARAYASADLFLHCSVTETFGLVVLEAMASGIPVIARDQGGPSDIIRHGQTGFLVPPKDLDQFTRLAREVLENASHRKKLSTAARQQAEDTTWEKINRRAAWQIAEALTNADQESHSPARQPRTGILAWVIEQICLVLAVGVVYGMWLIAVVPLIVHGHRFLPRAWHVLRNQFQCSRPL
jgi:glycogen synthase